MYLMTSPTLCSFSACSSGISWPNSSSKRHDQFHRVHARPGADIINDTWGGVDPGLPDVAAEFGAGLVCSHTGGAVPRTRPFRVNYGLSERGVVDDVIAEVTSAAERAVAAGRRPRRRTHRSDARFR